MTQKELMIDVCRSDADFRALISVTSIRDINENIIERIITEYKRRENSREAPHYHGNIIKVAENHDKSSRKSCPNPFASLPSAGMAASAITKHCIC